MFGWKPGIVYAYSTICPKTGKREQWAYVGQTRQNLVDRHNQHMGFDSRQPGQPWSDLYPEIRVIFQFKSCPDWWLDWVEKQVIKWTLPRYNYIFNVDNPRRIPKYQAVADRKQRDIARGRVRKHLTRTNVVE